MDISPRSLTLQSSSYQRSHRLSTNVAGIGAHHHQRRVRLTSDVRLTPVPPPPRVKADRAPVTGTELIPLPAASSHAGTLAPCPIARDVFGTFVATFAVNAKDFASDALFCEALLSSARTIDAENTTNGIVTTAAAAWALNVLAANPSNHLVRAIRDAVMPALFIGMASESASAPGSRSAGSSRAVATYDQLRIDREDIAANPFLAYDLFATEFNAVKEAELALSESKDRMSALMAEKQKGTKHVLRRWQDSVVRTTFRAWRGYAKNTRVERFARAQRERNAVREGRTFMLQAAFASWRLLVETARCQSLEEKVHATTYQLENAKNQFQLQCYRSDKYLRTVEELRAELKELREERDRFRDEVRDLERKLRKFREESRADLNYHVNELLHVINGWRQFARASVDEKLGASTLLALLDAERSKAAANAAANKTKGGKAADRPSSGKGDDGGSSNSDEEDEDSEDAEDEADAATAPVAGAMSPADKAANDEVVTERALLRWCSAICRDSVVSQVGDVRNFTEDFQSGEVLLMLMHHVFPSDVPFSPLQETNMAKRLELITANARELGLAHVPKPSDLIECTGDFNIMITAELFNRHVARLHADEQIRPRAGGDDGDEDARTLVKIRYDIDMKDAVLREAEQEMRSLQQSKAAIGAQEAQLLALTETITRHAGYLARERLHGNPVQVLDRRETGRYCRFNSNRFRDIAFKYKNPPPETNPEKWLPFADQLTELRKVLKKRFHTTRRVFKFYAGSKATMSDADFWRFCGDIRVLDRTFTRVAVDRIFAIANADDVPVKDGENDNEDGSDGDDEDAEDENPATELIPGEFVECLIRMADAKFGGKMIHERFEAFMSNFVDPFACKSEMDKFKKEIYAPSTQSAVQRYLKDFSRLFQHFAKASATAAAAKAPPAPAVLGPAAPGGSGGVLKQQGTAVEAAGTATAAPAKKKGGRAMMTLEGFVQMLSEANLLNGPLDESVITTIFKAVHGDDTTGEITVNEFLEVIVSCAVFRTANPFIGLDKKVDVFATAMISSLRARLKGVLPLSDVRPVTIQSLQR